MLGNVNPNMGVGHGVVDTQGLLLAVAVHRADLQNRDGARVVLARLKYRIPRLLRLWADAIYADPQLGTWVQAATDWKLAIVRHLQLGPGFQVLHRRSTTGTIPATHRSKLYKVRLREVPGGMEVWVPSRPEWIPIHPVSVQPA